MRARGHGAVAHPAQPDRTPSVTCATCTRFRGGIHRTVVTLTPAEADPLAACTAECGRPSSTIPNGVDPERFRPADARRARARLRSASTSTMRIAWRSSSATIRPQGDRTSRSRRSSTPRPSCCWWSAASHRRSMRRASLAERLGVAERVLFVGTASRPVERSSRCRTCSSSRAHTRPTVSSCSRRSRAAFRSSRRASGSHRRSSSTASTASSSSRMPAEIGDDWSSSPRRTSPHGGAGLARAPSAHAWRAIGSAVPRTRRRDDRSAAGRVRRAAAA